MKRHRHIERLDRIAAEIEALRAELLAEDAPQEPAADDTDAPADLRDRHLIDTVDCGRGLIVRPTLARSGSRKETAASSAAASMAVADACRCFRRRLTAPLTASRFVAFDRVAFGGVVVP